MGGGRCSRSEFAAVTPDTAARARGRTVGRLDRLARQRHRPRKSFGRQMTVTINAFYNSVKLGAVIDDIVRAHDYPAAVSALLAEAVALTAMLGAILKFDGKFILADQDRWTRRFDRGGFCVAQWRSRLCAVQPGKTGRACQPEAAGIAGQGLSRHDLSTRVRTWNAIRALFRSTTRLSPTRRMPISANPNRSRRGCGWFRARFWRGSRNPPTRCW